MKNKNLRVTVIVLNWNGRHFLEQNLNSVLVQNYDNFEVLVVDNASTDDSVDYLKQVQAKNNKLRFLRLTKNLGFTGGNNKGVEDVLTRDKSEFVVFLNNDIKVAKDWLKNLISGFTDSKIGICTSRILLYHRYQQIVVVPESDLEIKQLTIDGLDYHLLEFQQGFKQQGEILTFPKKLKKGEIYNIAVPYKSNGNGLGSAGSSRQRRGSAPSFMRGSPHGGSAQVTSLRVESCPVVYTGTSGQLKVEFQGSGLKVFTQNLREKFEKSGSIPIDLEGQYVIQNAGTDFFEKNLLFKDRFVFEFDKNVESEIVDAGCGGAMAVRSELLRKLGSFNSKYYMYLEDSELGFRFKKFGFLTKFVDDAICYHYFWGSSDGKITKTQAYYGTRNRLWFIRKYFGLRKFTFFYIKTIARTYSWLLKALSGNSRAWMFYKAYVRVLMDALKKAGGE